MPVNALAAHTTSVASSYHYQAANRFDGSLHPRGLVCFTTGFRLGSTADDSFSVVLVSIIWVIVLSRLEQQDVTCKLTVWRVSFVHV